jgi:hypothetical protein
MDRRFSGGGPRRNLLTVTATEAQVWTNDRVSCIGGKA